MLRYNLSAMVPLELVKLVCMWLLQATAVTFTGVHHVLHFVLYLMAGASAAGLMLVLYLLFQLEYDNAETQSAEATTKADSPSREISDKS
jgi:hypothetical protein